MKMRKISVILLCSILMIASLAACQQDTNPNPQPPGGFAPSINFDFQPMTIRFFVGGDPGDAFGSIVYRGAMDAAEILSPFGVTVEYVFSGWQPEQMVSQLREAIAARVDVISMMGHPGCDAIMPLAEEARNAGIIMMYQNTNVPAVREQHGGGFTGVVDLVAQGRMLGEAAIEQLGLQPGDRAVVFAPWGTPGRFIREDAVAITFEELGMTVERIQNPVGVNADPQLLLPLVTGQVQGHPDTRIIVYSGGQLLAAAPMYMQAVGRSPGDIFNIGFDLNAAVLEAFEQGYVQLTSDQQPYLQGFLPIINAFLAFHFEMSGLEIDTGRGLVDATNFDDLRELVQQGIR